MKFPCTSCGACGACCYRVRLLDPEWPTRPDGACINLTPEGLCGIYETRPDVCRSDVSKPPDMSLHEWYRLSAAVCNFFVEEDGLDPSFRVVIPEKSDFEA